MICIRRCNESRHTSHVIMHDPGIDASKVWLYVVLVLIITVALLPGMIQHWRRPV